MGGNRWTRRRRGPLRQRPDRLWRPCFPHRQPGRNRTTTRRRPGRRRRHAPHPDRPRPPSAFAQCHSHIARAVIATRIEAIPKGTGHALGISHEPERHFSLREQGAAMLPASSSAQTIDHKADRPAPLGSSRSNIAATSRSTVPRVPHRARGQPPSRQNPRSEVDSLRAHPRTHGPCLWRGAQIR